MFLRWTLSILTISSFVGTSIAVPIPGPNDIKKSSDQYRQAAQGATHEYTLTPGQTNVVRTENPPGNVRLPNPNEDADHLLEAQTVHRALNAQGHPFHTLPANHQHGIREILNEPANMAYIGRGLNRGKGQVTRHGLDGNEIRDGPARNAYTRATIPTAVQTAERMDHFLTTNGYQGNVRQHHMDAMRAANIVRPGEATPGFTPRPQHAVGQAGPSNHPHALGQAGPSNQHGQGHHQQNPFLVPGGSSTQHGGLFAQGRTQHPVGAPGTPARHAAINALADSVARLHISPGSSSAGSSPPGTPTPAHRNLPAHAGPVTPPRRGTHDPTLGTHAPSRDRTIHLPSTPQHQTGPAPGHHALGANAPARPTHDHEHDHAPPILHRSNSFGGNAGAPLVHHEPIRPHTPPSPSPAPPAHPHGKAKQ